MDIIYLYNLMSGLVRLDPTCLACLAPCGKKTDIAVTGNNLVKKQYILALLSGLSQTNLIFSRVLELSFHKSDDNNDFVKMGGFGGNTYKVKNLNKRLEEENLELIDRPFRVQIFSANVKREFTLYIVPAHIDECWGSNLFVDANVDLDFNKLANEHASSVYLGVISKNVDVEFETYQFYLDNVLRFAKRQDKTIFRNIINKKTNEEIIYDCPDFIFVADILWNDHCINNMHYIVIFKNSALMSIRDLGKSDIPLIGNAVAVGTRCIGERHRDVSTIKIETYFHYHPSIWLLHIHFVSSTIEEKHTKFMVSDVIGNLYRDPDYYRKNIVL